jgi:hypothetical protein
MFSVDQPSSTRRYQSTHIADATCHASTALHAVDRTQCPLHIWLSDVLIAIRSLERSLWIKNSRLIRDNNGN